MKWIAILLALSTPVMAAEKSPPLSLAQARMLLAIAGVSVGKIFADDPSSHSPNRYALTRLDSKLKKPNVFSVEIEITPLPKAGQ